MLTLLASNRDTLARALHGSAWRVFRHRLLHLLRSNTRKGSRRNIEAHYDIGNAFYREWLDPSMTYSSARFESPEQGLQDAAPFMATLHAGARLASALKPQLRTLLHYHCGGTPLHTRQLMMDLQAL